MKNLLNGIAWVGLVSLLGCGDGGGGKGGGGGGGGIITACDTGTCPFGSCSANQTLCIEYLAVSPATAIASLGPACALPGGTAVGSCSQAHDPNFVGECDLTETVTTGFGPLTTRERLFYPHSDEFPDNFGRGGCVNMTVGGTTFSDSHWTQLSAASGTGGSGGI